MLLLEVLDSQRVDNLMSPYGKLNQAHGILYRLQRNVSELRLCSLVSAQLEVVVQLSLHLAQN